MFEIQKKKLYFVNILKTSCKLLAQNQYFCRKASGPEKLTTKMMEKEKSSQAMLIVSLFLGIEVQIE